MFLWNTFLHLAGRINAAGAGLTAEQIKRGLLQSNVVHLLRSIAVDAVLIAVVADSLGKLI